MKRFFGWVLASTLTLLAPLLRANEEAPAPRCDHCSAAAGHAATGCAGCGMTSETASSPKSVSRAKSKKCCCPEGTKCAGDCAPENCTCTGKSAARSCHGQKCCCPEGTKCAGDCTPENCTCKGGKGGRYGARCPMVGRRPWCVKSCIGAGIGSMIGGLVDQPVLGACFGGCVGAMTPSLVVKEMVPVAHREMSSAPHPLVPPFACWPPMAGNWTLTNGPDGIHFSGPGVEGSCDRVHFGPNGCLALEGKVHVVYHKGGHHAEVQADQVWVRLPDMSIQINTHGSIPMPMIEPAAWWGGYAPY